jgi:hypothetical protein
MMPALVLFLETLAAIVSVFIISFVVVFLLALVVLP